MDAVANAHRLPNVSNEQTEGASLALQAEWAPALWPLLARLPHNITARGRPIGNPRETQAGRSVPPACAGGWVSFKNAGKAGGPG